MAGKRKKSIVPKSHAQQQKELRESAMPHVRKLVKRFGRPAVGWCVNQLRDYEKKMKELEQAKKDVAKMEAELKE